MRMLGEMAAANPQVGSFAEYARRSLGGWAGFSVGWLYGYFWSIVLAIEAVAGAEILQRWIDAPVWLTAVLLMALLTGINLTSVKPFGEFEFWFAGIKVVAIVVFIVIAAGFLFGIGAADSPGLSNRSHGFESLDPSPGSRGVVRPSGKPTKSPQIVVFAHEAEAVRDALARPFFRPRVLMRVLLDASDS